MSTPGTVSLDRQPLPSRLPHRICLPDPTADPISLMGSGQFDKAAILSPDFSGVEAASSGFSV